MAKRRDQENIKNNASIFAKELSCKIAQKCIYACNYGQGEGKKVAWGAEPCSGKGVIKPGRTDRIFRRSCVTVLIHPVILQQREQDNYNMS